VSQNQFPIAITAEPAISQGTCHSVVGTVDSLDTITASGMRT